MGGTYSWLGSASWYVYGKQSFGKAGFRRAAAAFDPEDLRVDLRGRVCLVTGANAGLGLATTLALARLGAEVHMLCRSRERGEAAVARVRTETGNSNVHLHVVDMASRASVRGALTDTSLVELIDMAWSVLQVKEFGESWVASGRPVHTLVNNAGVMLPAFELDPEGRMEASFATMVHGTVLLTTLLLPVRCQQAHSLFLPWYLTCSSMLTCSRMYRGMGHVQALVAGRPSRVINVSSGGMYTTRLHVDDSPVPEDRYSALYAYSNGKRAQVILTEQFAERLGPLGVCVTSMHPGWSETPGLERAMPGFAESSRDDLRSAAEGADTIVWLAAAKRAGDPASMGGRFFFDREAVPTHLFLAGTQESDADRTALWAKCARLCDIHVDASIAAASDRRA